MQPNTGESRIKAEIRAICGYRGTVPIECDSVDCIQALGFKIRNVCAAGIYTKFFLCSKNNEALLLKVVNLGKLHPRAQQLAINQSAIIIGYVCKQFPPPNVARVLEMFLIQNQLFLPMIKYTNGSLHRLLTTTKVNNNWKAKWIFQLKGVLDYLQPKGIVHRTVRLEHLLLDSKYDCFLTGWSRAVFLYDPKTGLPTNCWSEYPSRKRNHMPPECFDEQFYSPRGVDQWSFGVVILNILTNRHVFVPSEKARNFERQWAEFKQRNSVLIEPKLLALLDKLFVTDRHRRCRIKDLIQWDLFSSGKQSDRINQTGVMAKSIRTNETGKSASVCQPVNPSNKINKSTSVINEVSKLTGNKIGKSEKRSEISKFPFSKLSEINEECKSVLESVKVKRQSESLRCVRRPLLTMEISKPEPPPLCGKCRGKIEKSNIDAPLSCEMCNRRFENPKKFSSPQSLPRFELKDGFEVKPTNDLPSQSDACQQRSQSTMTRGRKSPNKICSIERNAEVPSSLASNRQGSNRKTVVVKMKVKIGESVSQLEPKQTDALAKVSNVGPNSNIESLLYQSKGIVIGESNYQTITMNKLENATFDKLHTHPAFQEFLKAAELCPPLKTEKTQDENSTSVIYRLNTTSIVQKET